MTISSTYLKDYLHRPARVSLFEGCEGIDVLQMFQIMKYLHEKGNGLLASNKVATGMQDDIIPNIKHIYLGKQCLHLDNYTVLTRLFPQYYQNKCYSVMRLFEQLRPKSWPRNNEHLKQSELAIPILYKVN